MIQSISPIPSLESTALMVRLVLSGCVCALLFITSQFYAVDPIFPPSLLFSNLAFSVINITDTCMRFGRSAITYDMIFYLQGPKRMEPLQPGTALIPF